MSQRGRIKDISRIFDKILGKTVSEAMGIHHLGVQAVPDCKYLELARMPDGEMGE